MRRTAVVFAALAVFVSPAACGGAPPSDLTTGFGPEGNDAGTQHGMDSGSTHEASVGQDSSAPKDASMHVDSSALPEASPPDVFVVEASTPVQVLCPEDGDTTMTCDPGQICCVTGNAQDGEMDICQSSGSGCQGTTVNCAASADCDANEVCCGTESTSGGSVTYTDVSCAKNCTQSNHFQFCDPTANDCPLTHPACTPSSVLSGYSVCE